MFLLCDFLVCDLKQIHTRRNARVFSSFLEDTGVCCNTRMRIVGWPVRRSDFALLQLEWIRRQEQEINRFSRLHCVLTVRHRRLDTDFLR